MSTGRLLARFGALLKTNSWNGGALPGTNEIGDLKWSARAAPSAGWLVCDGSAVSRTGATAALFAAIGTAYGAGNGSTTFNLPDFRGRAPVGAGTGPSLTARTLGQTGGAETHQLVAGEIPSHTHTGTADSAGNHTHTGAVAGTGSTNIQPGTGGATQVGTPNTTATLSTTGAHTHTLTINSTGGDGAHNNMQPFAVSNVFIYAG